jgi:hypothetical protein
MVKSLLQFRDVDELRDFVNETFCQHYQLKLGAFCMTERILRRAGKPCGVYFCLHGPRAVRFTAIWETDRNQILFYSSTGERFLKMQIIEAPSLERAAA